MKHEKKLMVINILVPILLFALLLFIDISEKFVSIISLTFIVGWALPYFALILTGLAIFNKSHKKLGLTINIINILLSLMLAIFIACILEKNLIVILVEYIIILLISIINTISFAKYIKDHPDPEMAEISRTKKANNGIIK